MNRSFWLLVFLFCSTGLWAQHRISARVLDTEGQAVPYANVALYTAADSSLVKVEVTQDNGAFSLGNVPQNRYFLVVSYLGTPDLRINELNVTGDRDLGDLSLAPAGVDLAQATVRTTRTLVEVKPDRTVFNVQGTINAAGNDGLDLLRKAPGVSIDNNDNISVLSRSGVLIYIDGRRLPLQGTDLSNYLRTLTAEQIDRIDIITSPGARYEAQGNAGIIDIRLKRAEDEGANGSLSASGSQGRYAQYAVNAGGNYRNDRFNVFANLSYTRNQSFSESDFVSRQNNFLLIDDLLSVPTLRTPGVRAGLDVYLGQRQTLGLLVSGQFQNEFREVNNSTEIFTLAAAGGQPVTGVPDSILRAQVFDDGDHNQNTVNLNYNFAIAAGHNLNVDLDYGRFRNDNLIDQPNRYFSPAGQPLSVANNSFDTPVDIDIYTARLDYEFPVGKGAASAGAKFSSVATDNTFLFYEGLRGDRRLIDGRSNRFGYDEAVYALYSSYSASLGERWDYSLGLRMEVTDATGALTAFAGTPAPPVDFDYLSLFPNLGITHTLASGNVLNLRYGRRINRPDYNSLNPFRVQLNELSYRRGNPFLQPEKINNVELGYVIGRRYNFKLAYSRTEDQVAQLLSPDSFDPRAGFETYDNLARQTVYSFTASAPIQLFTWWRTYLNATGGYLSNEADYGEGGTVNIEVFNYRFYNQNTFTLPGGFTAEVTGQYIGPGVGGGTFEYNGFGVINLGLQRRFLQQQLTAKLTFSDLLYSSVIDGSSNFNGLYAEGRVVRDSQRLGLSLSYNFGNQKVQSRRRDTGLEAEASRVH
ncbi:outer membrane receptor protein involved in Fe transport [Lewinella marina]|uniref:TonB-dependent receptor n=1 Tax=Neolewinella marina TaxID=438751 RepID=A0A2G0CCF0_9BACT|nr:TonB-dependent receptor [Neolewinella marina]NJB87699.1 outer membrane receptor protein involved in Fe transport [Neolewinella marina]PHK97622.1 TonB-dependent receptor [Neolewinella marina]